ncbi:hypothetical protein Chor_006219, partial [Crotalus horridus]
ELLQENTAPLLSINRTLWLRQGFLVSLIQSFLMGPSTLYDHSQERTRLVFVPTTYVLSKFIRLFRNLFSTQEKFVCLRPKNEIPGEGTGYIAGATVDTLVAEPDLLYSRFSFSLW